MITDGNNDFQVSLNVEYAIAQNYSLELAAILYCCQIPFLDKLKGKSLISILLYPGMHPGKRTAFWSAKFSKYFVGDSLQQANGARHPGLRAKQ